MNMKTMIVSLLMILFVSCSEKTPTDELSDMNANKDMPTPKSDVTTTNPNEALAPQTCYYGCKARK
jgi:PBP1b-binding outer membrane lipoprotein LpoB